MSDRMVVLRDARQRYETWLEYRLAVADKVLAALESGKSTTTMLAELSGAPHSDVYSILREMESIGVVRRLGLAPSGGRGCGSGGKPLIWVLQ